MNRKQGQEPLKLDKKPSLPSGHAARTDRLLLTSRKAMTALCGKLSILSQPLIATIFRRQQS